MGAETCPVGLLYPATAPPRAGISESCQKGASILCVEPNCGILVDEHTRL